ncbi:12089_t:CDS:2 [Cetraspora pellucida]|uniref:12089_t:CDS:1 n=1 Tax=Cetraspora pellucida TaxID=1433469 RepID=A0A9N9C0A4_9GLOM|nr:12089_t:CDS:2 [Cetraspora pellucida]
MSGYSRVPESDDVQVVELQVPSSTAESSASRSPSPAYSTHTANNNDIIESEPILENSKDTDSTDNEPENNGNIRFPILGSIKKQTAPAALPVVTDGVFSNLSAKPDKETSKEEENPPSYEIAAADATPPYWETTVIAPGLCGDEILVEGLPNGSRAGLGITLVQYGFYLRGRSFQDDGVYYNYEDDLSDKELARRAWLRVKRIETIMRTTPEESV